jgi:hypothetical protein
MHAELRWCAFYTLPRHPPQPGDCRRYVAMNNSEARDMKSFETCPVCGGAFSFSEIRSQFANRNAKHLHCPLCETGLLFSCGDILGHQRHEVDPSVPAEQWLGAYAAWYFPVGCEDCNCLILGRGYYPKNYSCCPGVIQLALEMAADPCHTTAVVTFLYKHRATFVNSLRGEFFASYDLERLRRFRDDHACAELASTIQSILDDRAT